jgi:hypothetical protein
MKKFSFIFILMIGILYAANAQSKISFDYSGAEKFYDLCTSEQKVNESDIDDLLGSKPYQQLFDYLKFNWGDFYNEALYRHMFQLCFLPDQHTLDPKFADGKWILRYLQKVRQNPELIKKYIATVNDNISDTEILKRAKTYLPKNTKEQQIIVYFIIGVDQGCASKEGVFIDHYYDISAEKISSSLVPWIAHESHHFFRSQFDGLSIPWKQKHPELFQAFYWLETEGLAEMTGSIHPNLPKFIQSEKNKNKIYLNFSKYIHQLNKSMSNYFNEIGDAKEILEVLHPPKGRNTYHEVGHLMAFYIEKALGREVLVNQIGKPLEFILSYQQATLKLKIFEDAPSFDSVLIQKLEALISE